MKKTIIALMALAGAAAASTEEVNTITAAWGTAPVVAGNCWSADYTLTFTLEELYTLKDSGSVLGFYRGSAADDKVTFTTTLQKGVTYTLSVTGGDQAMPPTLTWEGGSETLASYKGNMNSNAALTSVLNKGTITIEKQDPTIPEPTTATLSLLALAGLAALRRRR